MLAGIIFPARFLLLLLLLLLLRLQDTAALLEDVLCLLGFKQSVAMDPLNALSGWNPTDESPCKWPGVTCEPSSGRVTQLTITGNRINLSGQGLVGTLAPSLANLTHLRILSLPHNALTGNVLQEIGGMRNLEILELQGNNFSGGIPVGIHGLLNLRVLNLAYNSLSGSIPERIVECRSLKRLSLEGNFFNGSLPEKFIGFSGGVDTIDLSYNQFSGYIAKTHFGNCAALKHLHLIGNYFVGTIPAEIGNCSSLTSLLLSGNVFEGGIPAEIGLLTGLEILDVSRNSLTGWIPLELKKCTNLSVLVLTNLVDLSSFSSRPSYYDTTSSFRDEFNSFNGGIPNEIFLIPNLRILWAPRANLNGRLPYFWNNFCKLQILNLGLNYIDGIIPEGLSKCGNLSFVDLSFNSLKGKIPAGLMTVCIDYFNVSGNFLSGFLPEFAKMSCIGSSNSYGNKDIMNQEKMIDDIEHVYSAILCLSGHLNNPFDSFATKGRLVLHDFSSNNIAGEFHLPVSFDRHDSNLSYVLLLNNNILNGSLPRSVNCLGLQSFGLNLSSNKLSGGIPFGFFSSCPQLLVFEAANNDLIGPIPADIGDLHLLTRLNMRGNRLNGNLPHELAKLENLQTVFLGRNDFEGEIPLLLGQYGSMASIDLSYNSLNGSIPPLFANDSSLSSLVLNNNRLVGEIPLSFSLLPNLLVLDVSYNNLTGDLPNLQHGIDCKNFLGNQFLHPCSFYTFPTTEPPAIPPDKLGEQGIKLSVLHIAAISLACLVACTLIVLALIMHFRRKHLVEKPNQRRKLVMTFTTTCVDLTYDNVVKAAGNFSVANLIGTGGFGATYKAEVAPGFLVAVKRLAMGRFQGLKQFDAEIRTLGRIRHENLVTLIGYHLGEKETFLIYNYLPGGNLDSLIHHKSGKHISWPVIYKIAMHVANGLVFLHYRCIPRIVHRDIKPSNILLDNDLNAYISDFGLARLLEVSETHVTTDVAGTFGYVAPEYATTCRVSDKADVYSFGVVLFELLSGKRSLDPSFSEYGNGFNIVTWANMIIKEGRHSEFFSPMLWEASPRDKLIGALKIGSWCTVEMLGVRPSMKQVLDRLRQL